MSGTATTDNQIETKSELTLGEAAQRLGVSYRWVRILVERRQLAAYAIRQSGRGPAWRLNVAEVERFQARRADPSRP